MKNKVKYLSLLLLTSLLFLSGCIMGGDGGGFGGGFDLVGLIKNGVVQILIFLGVLYWLFKGGGGKK